MPILDCVVAPATPDVTEPSLAIFVTVVGRSFENDGVSSPGLSATWLAADLANSYISGVEFEYGPSDLSSGLTKTDPQRKAALSWSTTSAIVAGQTYTVRYRAVGEEIYGPWSAPQNVAVPNIQISTDTQNVGGSPAEFVREQVLLVAQLNTAVTDAEGSISQLNADVYTAVTGLKARSDVMFADINTATTGLKAKTDALLSTLNTPATGLIARVAASETKITENNTATVESLRVLDARARTVPNLIEGGDFSGDLTGLWSANDDPAVPVEAFYDSRVGSYGLVRSAATYFASKEYPATAGAVLSLSFDSQASVPGAVGAYVQWIPSYQTGATVSGITLEQNLWETRKRSPSNPIPAPAGTTGFRVVLVRNGSADFYVSRVKVNTGGEAADWSDEATISDSRARITDLDTVVTTPTTGLVSRMSVLESTVDTPGTGVAARLTTLNNIVTTPTTGLVAKTAVLESTVNTPVTGVSARLGTLEQVITTPTTGLAAKVTALETSITTPTTGLAARIGRSEEAITNLDLNKASAARVDVLEARAYSRPNLIVNSTAAAGMKGWTSYPGLAAPVQASTLNADGPYFYASLTGYHPSSGAQAYVASFPVASNSSYSFQAELIGVYLTGGTIRAYVAWQDVNGNIIDYLILNQNAADGWQRKQAENYVTGSTVTKAVVVIDADNTTFGAGGIAAWRRLKLELGTKCTVWTDDTTTVQSTARLATVETAVVENNTATVNRLQLLEASVDTPLTGVKARLGVAEGAIADLNTGKASAERVSFLEARTKTTPNLIPNSTGSAILKNWNEGALKTITAEPYAFDGARFIVYASTNAVSYLESNPIAIGPNAAFSFQAELYAGGLTSGSVRCYVAYFNAANAILTYQVFETYTDKAWAPYKSENFVSPSTAAYVRIYMDIQSATLTVAAWRHLKFEGGGVCTFWSDDATDVLTQARLTTAETTITTNNTAAANRLQILEAAVTTPVTGLSAKVASHDQAIADLNTGKASASSVSLLEVRSRSLPNLLANPQFSNGLDRWYVDGVNGATIQTDAQVGRYVNITGPYISSEAKPAFAGMQVSLSFDGDDGGASDAAVYIQWMPSYTTGAYLNNFGRSWTDRKFCNGDTGVVAPAGTTSFRIVAQRGASSAFNVARIKCNYGPKAAAWSSESEANDVYAKITTTSTVALDAQGKANASQTLVLDVNNYVSGTQSFNNGVISAFNVLADRFSVVAPGGGDRTEYLAAYGCWFIHSPLTATRTRYGKAFNSSQMIVWWTGPDSVPIGSETKANAYVYISQNTTGGPRFGGSDTGSGPTFTASAPGVRVKNQVGGSTTVTTASVTITPVNATGTVTYGWSNTFGDPDTTVSNSAGSTVTFSAVIPGVARVQSIWTWTATDSGTGITRSGQVFVTIMRDA